MVVSDNGWTKCVTHGKLKYVAQLHWYQHSAYHLYIYTIVVGGAHARELYGQNCRPRKAFHNTCLRTVAECKCLCRLADHVYSCTAVNIM